MGTFAVFVTLVEGGRIATASTPTTITVGNEDGLITAEEWAAFTGDNGQFNAAGPSGTAALWDQTGRGNSFREGILYTATPVPDDAALQAILEGLERQDNWPVQESAFCFLRGSLIRTPDGDVPIETLEVGDLVETLDSGPQPVRWIGRAVNAHRRHRPIRIGAGALGDGRPFRDLYLSPDHRVVIGGWKAEVLFGREEVLTAARHLVDGDRIVRVGDAVVVEYYHLLFDRHQIVTSNGLLSESFHPGEASIGKADEAVREEVFAIFPELREDMAAFGQLAREVVSAREARALMS